MTFLKMDTNIPGRIYNVVVNCDYRSLKVWYFRIQNINNGCFLINLSSVCFFNQCKPVYGNFTRYWYGFNMVISYAHYKISNNWIDLQYSYSLSLAGNFWSPLARLHADCFGRVNESCIIEWSWMRRVCEIKQIDEILE